MQRRCYDTTSRDYPNWGGRGIIVCDRWRGSFQNFFDDVGLSPSKRHSIDRINNDGNYEPGNVKWSTKSQQCNNQRRTRLLTHDGKTMSAKQWAEFLNVDYRALHNRLAMGWTTERTLDQPFRKSPSCAH
jgi:hypothetical protein